MMHRNNQLRIFGRCRMPMNLQLFAGDTGAGGETGGAGTGSGARESPDVGNSTSPQIDYAKIQQMLDGALSAREDSALKAYFKQQGLSQQEAEQAMTAFKQQKAANTPDVTALQAQLSQAQAAAQKAQLEAAATMAAIGLGIDTKTVPYVLKMADFSQVTGQDGKINEETLKNALNKVLEDVPALKPQAAGTTGFFRIGAPGSSGQGQSASDDALKKAFGL